MQIGEEPEFVYKSYFESPEACISSVCTTLDVLDSTKQTKEYIEKLEKHIDELEVDIEFFNEERQKQDAKIESLNNQITGLVSDNAILTSEIRSLTTDIDSMRPMFNYYIDKIEALEKRLDEQNKMSEL